MRGSSVQSRPPALFFFPSRTALRLDLRLRHQPAVFIGFPRDRLTPKICYYHEIKERLGYGGIIPKVEVCHIGVIRLDLAVHVVVTRWNNGHLRIQKSQRWSSSQGLHLEAALAIVDYSQASARWIFGQATGNRLANLILWEMCRNPGGLCRDTIVHEVCSGNTTKTQLNRALSELAKNKLAKMVLEKAEKGRPTERWYATT